MSNIYGYVRVSSREQHFDRQLAALQAAGVPQEAIFMDKISGKNFNRPQYRKLLRHLNGQSLVYIHSIDRLGRNYQEILEEWRHITKTIGADIVVLDMPLLDTRRGRNLVGTFVSDVVLQVLSFVAENERCNIRQRQAEGIVAAKKRGVRFGRPACALPREFYRQYAKWRTGQCSVREAAKACHMPRSTFHYKCRKLAQRKQE